MCYAQTEFWYEKAMMPWYEIHLNTRPWFEQTWVEAGKTIMTVDLSVETNVQVYQSVEHLEPHDMFTVLVQDVGLAELTRTSGAWQLKLTTSNAKT